MSEATEPEFYPCIPMQLPDDQLAPSLQTAIAERPSNRPSRHGLLRLLEQLGILEQFLEDDVVPPQHLALLVSKYWGVGGKKLTVAFLDSPPADTQNVILKYLNFWHIHDKLGPVCNLEFVPSTTDPIIRIARNEKAYYSYLGTDNLHIPKNQHTMMLGGITAQTIERELRRVVPHEGGHAGGWPHEHMRRQLVNRLDRQKTIAWGARVLGWSATMVVQQILTPLDEASIRGTPDADQDSSMCYELPGEITVDGQPIRGGLDLDRLDAAFAASIYPLAVAPPPPPPPPPPTAELSIVLARDVPAGTYTLGKRVA